MTVRRTTIESRWRAARCALVAAAAAAAPGSALAAPGDRIDFARDVRPLLADHCYPCHGPDAAARQASLRLDVRDGALAARRRGRPVEPGRSEDSLIIRRVTSGDDEFRMPPPGTEDPLTPEEIETLRAWIDQGADWPRHWAFVPPREPAPPVVENTTWPRNEIDRFILARLEAAGLAPAPVAPPETLIRRVTFDLTGLPPTPEELDTFLTDHEEDADGAYARLVDRLLDSPRYGEHMAVEWLDASRYADTHGYHYDNERTMWRWREWVIDAFNENKSFDTFTIEQLAGDLLPGATRPQKIATGFNRNHGITWEGGVIPEEYRIEYVVDRVSTTGTVWMGLTLGCARCHDHKYDPISQREFYGLSAFFNSIDEKGADGLEGNAAPFISAPTPEAADELELVEARVSELVRRRDEPRPQLDEAQAAWEASTLARERARWSVLEPFAFSATAGSRLTRMDDGSISADGMLPAQEVYDIVGFTGGGDPITAVRLEALPDERLPNGGPGRAAHSNFLLSELEIEAAPVSDPSAARRVRLAAAHADYSQPRFHVAHAIDGDVKTGWAMEGAEKGTARVAYFVPEAPFGFDGGTAMRFRLRYESDYVQHTMGRVRLAVSTDPALGARLAPTVVGPWHVAGPFAAATGEAAYATDFGPEAAAIDLAAAYGPGAIGWRPEPDLADGTVHPLEGENAATYLTRTIEAPNERTTTFSFGSDDAIKVWINGEIVLESAAPRGAAPDQNIVPIPLRAGANTMLVKIVNYGGPAAFYVARRDDHALEHPIEVTMAVSAGDDRSERQTRLTRDHFRSRASPEQRAIIADLAEAEAARAALLARIPTTMIMAERADARETFVLMRGRYDQPGSAVEASVPAVLPPLETDPARTPTRLDLARWLVRSDHPLTGRVAVNRFWQRIFGTGLVPSSDDFGVRGDRPTHPDLLDWLATAFARDWDVKAIQRSIVMSATYRQLAAVPPGAAALDPANAMLSRGPRFRLPAETIRDAALLAGGLLVERLGGPSVKPYQPAGLWKEVGSDFGAFGNVYVEDTGEGLYRRSLYTYWKRTLPPPALATFDAPSREFCVVRRARTNTPLQALVLMNDATYVEAARGFARRVMREGGTEAASRVRHAFRAATSRTPTDEEVAVVLAFYLEQRAIFRADPARAEALLDVGASPRDAELDPAELAAWTMVTSMILNLDETITKG